MRTRLAFWTLCPAVLFACGCGGAAEPTAPISADAKPEYVLAELLDKPRSELAEMSAELQARVTLQRRAAQEGRISLAFLPNLPIPLIVPIWTEATYSAKRGISLPPYVRDDEPDRELALHLATFGDCEGARLLANPQDASTQKAINEAAYERNYPAEWTRLTALLLFDAELRMAQGEAKGARDLLAYHWEIKKILGTKAAQGWLGQALLPLGRLAFEQAVPTWQKDNATELVNEGKAFLADSRVWPADLAFGLNAPYASIEKTFVKDKGSRAALATDPKRAFDVLSLPLPVGSVAAVVGFFDGGEKLDQVLVLYKPGLAEGYKNPEHLFRVLHDRGLESQNGEESLGMASKVYQAGKVRCEAAVMPRSTTVGGFVSLRATDARTPPFQLERSFGAASLDRSFEQNRLRLVPQQRKNVVATKQPEALALVTNPLPALSLQELGIERAPGQELTAGLEFSYAAAETKPVPLYTALMPFWSRQGFVPFKGVVDEAGGHFSFVWQDDRTRDELSVPFENAQPIRLRVGDRSETGGVANRVDDTRARDHAERQARLANGKPIQRIPRKLDQFFLGATRDETLGRLPTGHTIMKREISDGLTVTYPTENSSSDQFVLRQAFVRFDPQGRTAEVRIRYDDGPSRGKGTWAADMLKDLRKRCGAPEAVPCPWTAVWTDLPPQKPAPSSLEWVDDLSRLRYSRDAGGVELALTDCPPDQPTGVVLSPMEALSRGPEGCSLGMTRDQINQAWTLKQKPTTAADGALVLRPAPATGFDALLVWFDKDQVVRVVGRHAQPAGKDNANMSEALRADWAKNMRTLGWPRRQDSAPGNLLQGLAWHDDVVRVRVFWQEPDDGPSHVFTEWKALAGH
jgi:hypothetical protein